MSHAPTLHWFRRDLRLDDNPALALTAGQPLIALYILSPDIEAWGAAARWRLHLSLERLRADLTAHNVPLILRRGDPRSVLSDLVAESGAGRITWSRLYDASSRARDTEIKSHFTKAGLTVTSANASLLFEPWTVATGTGGPYRVYSPFWRAVRTSHVAEVQPTPKFVPFDRPLASDALDDWGLQKDMRRGGAVVAHYTQAGTAAALDRLDMFMNGPIADYKAKRDIPSAEVTSGQSEYLTYGEMSPRRLWWRGKAALERGMQGAEHFLKELVWREFAWHLMYHDPHLAHDNWREGWQGFSWRDDNDDAERWRQGRTGEPFVDAAMREMFVTGKMHNRARMIVASYLTKHLLTDWRVGQAWFADCLTDWDPASNAMGWQWVAGCGPDASPYFRVFNPALQQQKFDPKDRYINRWIAEGQTSPSRDALRYFEAVPKNWGLSPDAPYPAAVVELGEGRRRALAAYEDFRA